LFEPGTQWLYGTGIDVLGFIVEKISGMPLKDYLKANVFDKLGMNDTFMGAYPPESPKHVPIHLRTPDGSALSELPLPVPEDRDVSFDSFETFLFSYPFAKLNLYFVLFRSCESVFPFSLFRISPVRVLTTPATSPATWAAPV
jgi:CubicO group peptidase (beta-lactamase class C family)